MKKLKTKLSGLIITNWVTSLVGLLLIALATVILFYDKATFTELSFLYGSGLFCLGAKDKWFKFNKTNILLIALIVFVACKTPEQKFNKLVKKYPYLITLKSDTIRDTFYFPKIDTTTSKPLNDLLKGDSLNYKKDKLEVTVKYDTVKKEIYLKIYQKADTVYKWKQVPKYIIKSDEITLEKALDYIWNKYWYIFLIAIILFILVLFILK